MPSILQSDVGGRCWIATARLDGRSPNYQLLITAASWRRQYQKLGIHHPQSKGNILEEQEPPWSWQGIRTSPLHMASYLCFWATAWSLDVKQVYSVSVCPALRFWGRLWEIGAMEIVGPVIVQSQRLTIICVHSSSFTEGQSFMVKILYMQHEGLQAWVWD